MSLRKLMLSVTTSSMVIAGLVAPTAKAATVSSVSNQYGPWAVQELAHDNFISQIETFKVDRNLVAWTSTNEQSGMRYLRAWDGAKVHSLSSRVASDWSPRNDFYEPVEGSYDVADGVVTWAMFDGMDMEIYYLRNGQVVRLTDNDYDDLHPVTSSGRIAWTAFPSGAYTLMVAELDRGIRTVASYHVMNYAFSGDNLYWLNVLPGENWFRVFVDDGVETVAIGKGDDRPMTKYFFTDGNGSAAWEYSTKRWDYDKRETFVSDDGAAARRVLLRDVPPNVTRVEDVRGADVLVNTHDLLTSQWEDVTVLKTNGNQVTPVTMERNMTKIRFTDDSYVWHETPNTSSPLLVVDETTDRRDFISIKRIRHEVFEADANTVAAAYHEDGGLMLYRNNKITRVPTAGHDVRALDTKNDTTVFVYGEPGSSVLAVATPLLLVGNSAGTEQVSGRLVKATGSQSVYLATADGARYVFPGEGQFYSWYSDFGSLQTLPAEELSAMPLKGSVLYPADQLVKTPSSPEVYVVGTDGELHWVTDGLVLDTLYGSDWRHQVADLPAAFFTAYRVGQPVSTTNNYYRMTATR